MLEPISLSLVCMDGAMVGPKIKKKKNYYIIFVLRVLL